MDQVWTRGCSQENQAFAEAVAAMSFPDLPMADRHVLKAPSFTAACTLAIGIAATTAVFPIVEAVLLTPLPFAQSVRLASLADILKGAHVSGNGGAGVTPRSARRAD